jgi:tRNA pseudouridine38-40 synthase
MTRYRATVAYDGTAYLGWQRQTIDLPSVQATLEQALARISGQQVSVIGAGRTDTGVHATGQVIAFELEWTHGTMALLKAMNQQLPLDIALQDLTIQTDFHPRFDALSRRYVYQVAARAERMPLWQRTAWQVKTSLDLEVMNRTAQCLVGRHDFATFGTPPKPGGSTIREVFQSQWTVLTLPEGELLCYCIEATACFAPYGAAYRVYAGGSGTG